MKETLSRLTETPGRIAEAARELVRRRADLVVHARGSLQEHLLGVHDILERWGQPERVRLAGLLHSGYSTEAFAFHLFAAHERPRVRELIGAGAERLVFAFCACDPDALRAAAESTNGAIALASRWRGAAVRLDRRDVAEVMMIHAANLAEQACGARWEPVPWLATASVFVRAARPAAEVVPPVFGKGTLEVTPDEEARLLAAYGALLLGRDSQTNDGSGLLAGCPVGEPLLLAGLVALASGRGREAARLGEQALTAFDGWGVSGDKRLGVDRWRRLGDLLVHDGQTRDRELETAGQRTRAPSWSGRAGRRSRIWTHLDALRAWPDSFRALPRPPPPPSATVLDSGHLPPRFAQYIGALRTNAERPIPEFYPGLRTQPWYDPGEFGLVTELERLAPEIAEEVRAFETDYFQDEAEDIGRTGRWSVLFLVELGRRNKAILERCPVTASVIEKHRTLTTRGGLIYFSCLDPRTRIAPHQGPTNQRLRCHLGLEVPDGCGMRVGGVVGSWQEGRCVVFDDSFWHEAWNDSDRRRVVLIVDLWHPDLSDDEVALLSGLQRYGAANASGAERSWARNDAARRRARDAARKRR